MLHFDSTDWNKDIVIISLIYYYIMVIQKVIRQVWDQKYAKNFYFQGVECQSWNLGV